MIPSQLYERIKKFKVAGELQRKNIYPYFRQIDENHDTEVVIGNRRYLMFGSNSYLGLTNHPKVKEASIEAIRRYGTGSSGSRFLNGNCVLHTRLEEQLAAFTGKKDALVFSTGYQTNLGVVGTLTGRTDYIFLDEMNHASIIEGSRLSFSRVYKYGHGDMKELEHLLRSVNQNAAKLIIVDGVFSMEGDVVSLPEITSLAKKFQATVMVDDAHSLGVLGDSGKGTASHFNLTDEVDLIMGTFSKSFASIGGFIASGKDIIHYLRHHARSLIFSASIPPAAAAAALASLEIMKSEPERLEKLWDNTRYLRRELEIMGYDTGHSNSPIIPIYIRDDMKTFLNTRQLMQEGIFVNPVVSPGVPPGSSLIRLSVMATHTKDQIDYALEKIKKVIDPLAAMEIFENNYHENGHLH
jgi:8-amino-7-oxononanoate synthase